MALPAPNLDDRTFQDLVNEARRRIPLHCPEWTDHNLSDPGITLIELFAWMTEMLIYRLNKVPDKNYTKFLELLGLRLTPANPATTEVSFRLTAPPASPVTIPSGTEVATVRTETRDAIVFTTDRDSTTGSPCSGSGKKATRQPRVPATSSSSRAFPSPETPFTSASGRTCAERPCRSHSTARRRRRPG